LPRKIENVNINIIFKERSVKAMGNLRIYNKKLQERAEKLAGIV
jgi:hypothetical protein